MLTEITDCLRDNGPMSLTELAGHFKTDVSAVEGMLELLERKGRVERIGGGKCATCKGCALVNPSDISIFRVPSQSRVDRPGGAC